MDDRLRSQRCYEFGEYRLDPNRRVIHGRGDGRRLVLPPKVFDAALYFVQRPGQLLSKERLLAELWPGVVVEENTLAQVISTLRRALGEARGENRYVVTVPRRGYRFVAEVRIVTGSSEWSPADEVTVAVLPFVNWSTLADDQLLALGIAESIRHRLAAVAGIRLVSEAPHLPGARAERFEIRPESGPRLAVQGSLQRSGPRLRITVRLVDQMDGSHLWSLLFNHLAEDVFAMEDKVARRVVSALCESLLEPERPVVGSHVWGD